MPSHIATSARLSRPRVRRAPAPATRPGMTMLEVILAVLLLAVLVVSITSSISLIAAMESRARQRTNACELANRLILQYLDDEKSMPSDSLPLDYGKERYFWKKQDWNVRMNVNRTQESTGPSLQGLNRYKMVRVTVFESDESGDYPRPGVELVHMERIYDPATARNPDSAHKLDEEGIRKMINSIFGSGGTQ